MNILFIISSDTFIDPLGLAYLSAVAQKRGHDAHLARVENNNLIDIVKRIKPEVVAFASVMTGGHSFVNRVAAEIKKVHSCLTIMGGPHPTFYSQALNEEYLDAICIGEGETAFDEFLACVENGKSFNEIASFHTKEAKNPMGNLVSNLDDLPFPDRDLFFKSSSMGNFPMKIFMTSRGCPFPCTHCFNKAYLDMYQGKGKALRRHSVDRVIEEISRVKRDYPLDFVAFEDDLFALRNDAWLEEFAQKYKEKINIPYYCLARVDTITDALAKTLKASGCHSVSMSIECGNEEARSKILLRKMSNETIVRGFKTMQKYGIRTTTNIMIGIPYSTIENELESIDLCIESGIDCVSTSILCPYPGTEIGNYCKEKGIFDMSMESYEKISYRGDSVLTCFTAREKNIQKNIVDLGTFAAAFPFLKRLIFDVLIYLPNNIIYVLLNSVLKSYLLKKYIYPTKLSFSVGLKSLIKYFKGLLWNNSTGQPSETSSVLKCQTATQRK